MDMALKERFMQDWNTWFPGADLPIGFYYSDTADAECMAPVPKGHRCFVADLTKVRKGKTLCFNTQTIGCFGGKRYLGFDIEPSPDLEYFLSYGIAGKMEGERYKKSPELAKEYMKHSETDPAPADFIVFKRWDRMEAGDNPSVIIFFAAPDVLSGLFTLANFDEREIQGVIAPFGAGCTTIVAYPLQELKSEAPRAVLGMFDVSARPCVPANILTFAVPWPKFVRMADNMKESFLITKSWDKVRKRMGKDNKLS